MAPWILGKFLIWVALVAVIAVINQKPEFNKTLWWVVFLLGGLAAYLAGFKPEST